MTSYIHRPRQAIGLIYLVAYIVFLFTYVFILKDDQSWQIEPKFTATVFIWFTLSLAVKASMVMNRVIELLNVTAMVAFLSIGLTYHPNPDAPSSIQNFCYHLSFIGGSACDIFDFIYEGAAKRPEETVVDS
jgi:hypothetical protein